jgi:hypothetical protein
MHRIGLLALGAALLVGPALAQTAPGAGGPGGSPAGGTARQPGDPPSSSAGAPVDRGPHTPEANRAHRSGGAVLEGAPGAPAPAPQPTPPTTPALTR